jgi:hypothetical protein
MDAALTKRSSSPARQARIAGAFYVLSFLSAILAEALVHGKMLYAAGLAPVLCFTVVTLILYRIFVPVSRGLSLLAALLNLTGLAFEGLELQPGRVNVALVLHGGFCLLIALLVLRSKFLPRILGLLMALAGLAWLVALSPHLARELHAYVQAVGFAGEGVFMLWLLARGVNDANWYEQAGDRHPDG